VPKALAKAGAWVEEEVPGEDPFIRPWMVDIADDHYALDIRRARTLLGSEPKHSLRTTLPRMIESLEADPVAWYEANRLNAARVAGRAATTKVPEEREDAGQERYPRSGRMPAKKSTCGGTWPR
jgi:hypothetical protein